MIWRTRLTCTALLVASRPGAVPQGVLQPDAHVPAHRRRHGRNVHLVAAGAEHRPAVLVAEQPVGGALHVHDVLGMVTDAALQPEHRLDEQRRLHQPLVEEVFEIVEVGSVVAFELEARVVARAGAEDVLDLSEGVAKDDVLVAEIGALPLVLQVLEAVEHAEQPEVHRAEIERGDLRLERRGGAHALLDGHGRGAAGRQVDDDGRTLLDDRQELAEGFGRLVRRAGLGVAGVKVDDRGAGLRRADRLVGDLLGRHGQVGRHRRRVDRPRDRAGDDDFACGHNGVPSVRCRLRTYACERAAP